MERNPRCSENPNAPDASNWSDYTVSIQVTTGGNFRVNFVETESSLTEIFNVATPIDISSGTVGLYNIYNTPSYYDDIVVTEN